MSRRTLVGPLVAGGTLLAGSISIPQPAPAAPAAPARVLGHGSWTAHSYVLTDPSPSSYVFYGRTAATQQHDFGHAYVSLWNDGGQFPITERSATCGQLNEGCLDTRTPSVSFSQGGTQKRINYLGCAFDVPDHVVEGPIWDHLICTKQGWAGRQLTGAHFHRSSAFN